jgi:hypothetical protein
MKLTEAEIDLIVHKGNHTPQNSRRLYDVRGIHTGRICDECIDRVKMQFEPWAFGEGSYDAEEPLEDP